MLLVTITGLAESNFNEQNFELALAPYNILDNLAIFFIIPLNLMWMYRYA